MPLSQDEQKQYKDLYLKSAHEYITELKDTMNKLQSGDESEGVIDTLHRDAHSLKGQSAMMDFTSVNRLSYVMEHVFQKKKEKALEIKDELAVKLNEAIAGLENCMNEIEKTDHETDLSEVTKSLESLAQL